jgi:hypothetical protein
VESSSHCWRRAASVYGFFAARLLGVKGTAPNDIDVMMIGTPDAGEVYEICTHVEAVVHRLVSPTILTPAELADQSGFLDSVVWGRSCRS